MSLKGNILASTVEKAAVEFVVGGSVESKCGKCKSLTKHIVIALEDEKPSKVGCTICEAQHKCRPAPKPRVAKAPGASKKNAEAQEWAKLSPKWDEAKAKPYSMKNAFKRNDVIKHPDFGLGQVQQLVEPNKMRVLFEPGVKLMVCTM